MKITLIALTILASTFLVSAQPSGEPIRLWTGDAPGAFGTEAKDIPTLTPYLPSKETATGAAMVICPGGAYAGLARHEGEDYALWLRDHGIAAFVLKYRLGSAGYRHPVQHTDVSRAIRYVRAHAAEYNIDTNRVGVMGSSAGGHLASTALTKFDNGKPEAEDPIERQSSRPDLGILCYPVITMGDKTHAGSRRNLLGENPSPELIRDLSSELNVTSNTPPTFIFHTVDDKVVAVENAMKFATALRENNVPFSLHIYESGPHGSGLGHKVYATYKEDLHPWTANCLFWLKSRGWVK